MTKKDADEDYSPTRQNHGGTVLEMAIGDTADHTRLFNIGTCINAIQEKIDIAYGNLCRILPQINREIYRTFQKALETLDSLSSKNSSGKIEATLTHIKTLLETVRTDISRTVQGNSGIVEDLEAFMTELACVEFSETGLPEDPSGNGSNALNELRKILSFREDILITISAMNELADAVITDINSHIGKDIDSLEQTLNSMIFILKDLIERSNSTKEPIVRIMSGLQTHDIVNQDINNISCGLAKIRSLRIRQENSETIEETMFFQKRASFLSHDLITKLILVIRNHGSSLENEIRRIEEIVSQVKEDKDTIADFLLVNVKGQSTFDMVIHEISEMLDSLFDKIKRFSSMRSSCRDMVSDLIASGKKLKEYGASDVQLPVQISQAVERGLSALRSLESSTDSPETARLIEEFCRSMSLITSNLKGIRTLLIESIEGIDIYSGRCMDSISRFRQDITVLIETLDGSDYILAELETFSSSISSSPELHLDDESIREKIEMAHELLDLLHRLENPHSNSLMKGKTDDFDEGITLF